MATIDPQLAALADAHGVATWYEDGQRRRVDVSPEVVAAVLEQLGVDANGPAGVRDELNAVREREQNRPLPPTIVVRQGSQRRLGRPAELHREDGNRRDTNGDLPPDLPLGWHRLVTDEQEITLAVVPPRLPEPPRAWGWALQLYALRSNDSWGMGDFTDLGDFACWAGDEQGADLVLLNPLHGVTPTLPVQPSPYTPSSRRFTNPLYLRVEETEAYLRADAATRARIDALRVANGELIEHDAVWTAKRTALELLLPYVEPVDVDEDPALRDFATFCTLAEQHGPRWSEWPASLRHPQAPDVAQARVELAPRVLFHAWLQRLCTEQLGRARAAAAASGLSIGIVHDLAVGVDPQGADGWALQDVLASNVTVGAPPDAFNQLGQNWGLPPWRPDRLAETGYGAYRDMLRSLLRHADGIRVDHVAGLWRLWWILPGQPPTRGTYVRYDADALLGILALEAHRANALVVGEDLGTVEPIVTTTLRDQNMLGSSVLWFQRDEHTEGEPLLPPARWPRLAMASISTHDLPTAAGFLRGEHVRVRAELELLTNVDTERERAEAERRELVSLLVAEGLIEPTASEDEIIIAMHALLAKTPSQVVLVSPYDVIGEVRQPNLPGTIDEYPNWRLPLPLTLDELKSDPRVRHVIEALGTYRGA